MDLLPIHCPNCDTMLPCRDIFKIHKCPSCLTEFILDDGGAIITYQAILKRRTNSL